MKTFTKFAIAACVLFAVLGGITLIDKKSGIALADVYTNVLQSKAFMYQISTTMTGMGNMMGQPEADANSPTEMNMTVTISELYGMKMENHIKVLGPEGKTQDKTQLAYLLPEEKVIINIIPEQKRYQRFEFTDDLLEQAKQKNKDPRRIIKQMMRCQYIELEQTEIDGIKVQGFQTTDPAYTLGVDQEIKATLWVDVETWMPVKNEIYKKISGMEMYEVIDCYQWDIPVTAADFEYVIPEDYVDQGSMKMPEMNEETAIEGLRIYSKYFGQYPEKIDEVLILSLAKKLKEINDNPATEFAKEFVEKMNAAQAQGDQTVMQQTEQEFMPVTALAMFYMKLQQDKKEPAYYGEFVTPGDAKQVLLHWKTDGTTYKVIMGDLSVIEMSVDQLKQVEPQPTP